MKLAVIAHFDSSDKWHNNFLDTLSVINNLLDKTIVVTTSQKIDNLPKEFLNVKLIKRPNIGYDFYSYKVGYSFALEEKDVKSIFFINSSFFLLDKTKFRNTLKKIIRKGSKEKVIGISSSNQYFYHLQSYLFYIQLNKKTKSILEETILSVEPENTKHEVIMNYEIGFSKILIKSKLKILPMLSRNNILNIYQIYLVFIKTKLINSGFTYKNLKEIFFNLKNINWSLIGSKIIAKEFGIVKAEIIKNNIYKIDLEKNIWKYCKPINKKNILKEINESKIPKKENKKQDFLVKISGTIPINEKAKTAIALHLFYIELLEELLESINNIIVPFNLFVTTPFESFVPKILDLSKKFNIPVTIFICTNVGRDIYPFLKLYRSGLLDNYNSVLKIHSKKSAYSKRGDFWRRSLIYSLCGTSLIALKSIKMFEKNCIGIVGPYKYFIANPLHNGGNIDSVNRIYKLLNIGSINKQSKTSFFAGSMFWFNPKALELLKLAEISNLEFEEEKGQQDGTLAHAYERIFVSICEKNKFKYADINKGIFSKDEEEILSNTVPVL